MEQEVPVIHSAAKDSAEKQLNPAGDGRIPEQIREISDSLSDAFARFRQSDSYDSMIDIAEQSRTYIRKKTAAGNALFARSRSTSGNDVREKKAEP